MFKIKWTHTEFADFTLWTADNLWSSLYITKYILWTLHSSEKTVFSNNQWKVSKLLSVKRNTALFDSVILNKKDVLWPPKKYVFIENKNMYDLFNYFLLEKVVS